MSNQKYKVCFVLGPPGCGKGTQCTKVAKEFGFVHLSAGDLLRAERDRKGSTYGELIEEHIKQGTIVPIRITCALLENAMKENAHVAKGFLIDGFPRNMENFDGWKLAMDDKINFLFLLWINCPADVCIDRVLGRNQGRSDDNVTSFNKRINIYESETMEVVNWHKEKHLVKNVDATKSPDEVFEQLKPYFDAVV